MNLSNTTPNFLAGFSAERYKSGLKAVWERAKLYINKILRNDIRAIIKRGCDVVGTVNISTNYNDIKYKHMLLPVWISAYTFKDKVYNFFINGQTGEVQGPLAQERAQNRRAYPYHTRDRRWALLHTEITIYKERIGITARSLFCVINSIFCLRLIRFMAYSRFSASPRALQCSE